MVKLSMLELRKEVVYMQETEGKHCTQLQTEMYSVKMMMMMKAEDECRAQLRNNMYTVKIMKVRDERYAHLQNKMESLKKMVKAEEKHRAELWNVFTADDYAEGRRNTPCSLSERDGFNKKDYKGIILDACGTDG
jgi:hypothetical protein